MVSSSIMGIAALAAAVVVEAQSTTAAVTPSPIFSTITTTRSKTTKAKAQATAADVAGATHTVAVGASGFQFSPSKVTANVGDTIEWIFYPDGHSVIRAEYGFPCTPYEYIDIGRQGFYSGPEPVKAITNDMPRYRVRVNDTDPIFFYCGAPGSCYKEKMIGVINENSTATLDGQLDAALPLTTQILPGEPFPTESDGRGSNGQVINNYHHTLSGGAIAGVVIGCLAFVLFGGVLVYLCGRRGGLNRAYRRASTHPQGPSAAQAPPVTEINYTAQPKSPATQGWRNSHYSQFSNVYADQHTPLGQFSPPVSPQPTGFMQHGYYDHRVSSIAPSIAVEAPNNEAVPPPAPEAPPVELPASEDPGNGALPAYQARFSFAGQEADYRPSKE
ncbi:extracellular serine-rich protein [Colletotrichum karsti]|uniref:Extracellular serine-rich protein n=1 Tax=Colletotrichum karsti TaxID=1095194 RepID=A0A9P6LNF7_9PEZI|nr:extracellular serine-rich protein [Colletotrichum karsti]KAF9879151.1 extracellular serine-rich protein [Colletotrichum karsti]